MGKAAANSKRSTSKSGDVIVDQLAVVDARNMLFSNLIGMGWRMAVMVLVPIFLGVQIDKRFDSKPSATMAAFFIAVAGASWLIYRSYSDVRRRQLLEEAKQNKQKRNKRSVNV